MELLQRSYFTFNSGMSRDHVRPLLTRISGSFHCCCFLSPFYLIFETNARRLMHLELKVCKCDDLNCADNQIYDSSIGPDAAAMTKLLIIACDVQAHAARRVQRHSTVIFIRRKLKYSPERLSSSFGLEDLLEVEEHLKRMMESPLTAIAFICVRSANSRSYSTQLIL